MKTTILRIRISNPNPHNDGGKNIQNGGKHPQDGGKLAMSSHVVQGSVFKPLLSVETSSGLPHSGLDVHVLVKQQKGIIYI